MYKNSIYVLAISSVPRAQNLVIKSEITNILKLKSGDEIIFILDRYGHIHIRKGPAPLKKGEKFISCSTVGAEIIIQKETLLKWHMASFRTHISRDVIDILELGEYKKILWISDKDGNITLRNAFLPKDCAKAVIGREGAIIISMIEISEITAVPIEISEALDLRAVYSLAFGIDEFENIFVNRLPQIPISKLLGIAEIYHKKQTIQIHFDTNILQKLHINIGDKILWILDEDGNIIIKNNILPKECK